MHGGGRCVSCLGVTYGLLRSFSRTPFWSLVVLLSFAWATSTLRPIEEKRYARQPFVTSFGQWSIRRTQFSSG